MEIIFSILLIIGVIKLLSKFLGGSNKGGLTEDEKFDFFDTV